MAKRPSPRQTAVELAVARIVAFLHETRKEKVKKIHQIARVLGVEFCEKQFARTLELARPKELADGHKAQQVHLGDLFLNLVKQELRSQHRTNDMVVIFGPEVAANAKGARDTTAKRPSPPPTAVELAAARIAALLHETREEKVNRINHIARVLDVEFCERQCARTLELARTKALTDGDKAQQVPLGDQFLDLIKQELLSLRRTNDMVAIFGQEGVAVLASAAPGPPICPFCSEVFHKPSNLKAHIVDCQRRSLEADKRQVLPTSNANQNQGRTKDGYPIEVCSSCHRRVCLKPHKQPGLQVLHEIDGHGFSSERHICKESTFDLIDISYEGGLFDTDARRH